MNTSIAAASLLGFGDKEASVAFQEFGQTLTKIYDVQEKQLSEEEASRKSVIDEYNKDRRTKKKRESDLTNILSGLNKKSDGGRSKSGAKKKKGGLLSKILLGAGITLAGAVLFNTVKDKVFEAVKTPIEEMVDPIVEAFETVLNPIKEFFGGGEEETTSAGGGGEEPPSGAVPDTAPVSMEDKVPAGKTQVNDIEENASNKERYKIIYDIAKQQGDPIPELTAAQAMFESAYLKSTLATEGNNPFGQSGAGDAGKVDYKNASIVSTTTGWAKYSSLETAVAARIKRWSKKTPQGNPGYGEYETPIGAMKGIIENYAPAKDANNHADYLGAVERIMKDNGHNPHRKLAKGGRADGKKLMAKKKKRKGNGPKSEDTIDQIKPIKRQKGGKVFLHWAASDYSGASPNYHATVQGDGSVVKTMDYNTFGGRHTYRQNNEGIGISLAAMAGATTNNFGQYPVRPIQYENMAKLVAEILTNWGHGPSYVNDKTVPTHAEAGRDLPGDNYGPVAWGGDGSRWDLWKLYENDANGSGGPKIRNMIKRYMASGSTGVKTEDAPTMEDESGSSMPGPAPMGGPGASSSPGGVTPPAPAMSIPSSIDDVFSQFAANALAPIFGALGAITGNPLPNSTSEESGGGNQNTSDTGSVQVSGGLDKKMSAVLGSYEGLRTEAYADAVHGWSVPTIGIGATYYPEGFRLKGKVKKGDTITKDEAYEIKAAHVKEHRVRLLNEIGSDTYNKLPNNVKFALESVVFNYGSLSGASGQLAGLVKSGTDTGDFSRVSELYRNSLAHHNGGINSWRRNDEAGIIDTGTSQRTGIQFKTKLQQGGMVGQEINTGRMRGIQNAHMAKLREVQQKRKRKSANIIRVPMPTAAPAPSPILVNKSEGGMSGMGMTMSMLADLNRRLAMGALT